MAATLAFHLLVATVFAAGGLCHPTKFSKHSVELTEAPSLVDTACMNTNCGSAYQTCVNSAKCQQLLVCLDKCDAGFTMDTSLMKSNTLSCATTCIFTYADFYFTGFSRCMIENKCLKVHYVSAACRYPDEVTRDRYFQISDLKGGWWVARGYYPAMDCVACQHTFFDGFQYLDNQFVYRPTFEALTLNGSYTYVNGSILVDLTNTKPGEPIELDYLLYGVPVHTNWHVLTGTADNSTILVYYCGDIMKEWNFEGALILSRSPVLPEDAEILYSKMVSKSVNLPYVKFCKPQLAPCPN